jgi:MFS family permease
VDEANTRQDVEANLAWNLAVNLLDITMMMFALNLVSRATILPLLVSRLTPSRVAVGLVSAVYSLAYLLPQLLTASYAEGLRRKKPFVMLIGGLGERIPFLLMGVAVWGLAEPAPAVTVAVILFLLAVSGASNGVATPAWFDLIAKVIPVYRRGVWAGLGHSLGALLGMAGAGLAAWALSHWPFPRGFSLCFLAAFGAMVISWIGLALNREPDTPVAKPRSRLPQYLRELPGVLRRDANYARFLAARWVSSLGGMAAGFYIVYGSEHLRLGGAEVGFLTAVLTGSQAVMNVACGAVADRRGHKSVLLSASLAMALASIAAWAATSAGSLWVAFALLGTSLAGNAVSSMNIVLEFCRPEDRPTYIALTNTLLAPTTALAPLAGGWLATLLGYRAMFALASAVSILGATILALWTREPRGTALPRGAAPSDA